LKPQSWAAGAPLLAVRTLLGLDVTERGLRSRPHLPDWLGTLEVRGITVRGRRAVIR
jgi:glycogen debranching enzyme